MVRGQEFRGHPLQAGSQGGLGQEGQRHGRLGAARGKGREELLVLAQEGSEDLLQLQFALGQVLAHQGRGFGHRASGGFQDLQDLLEEIPGLALVVGEVRGLDQGAALHMQVRGRQIGLDARGNHRSGGRFGRELEPSHPGYQVHQILGEMLLAGHGRQPLFHLPPTRFVVSVHSSPSSLGFAQG